MDTDTVIPISRSIGAIPNFQVPELPRKSPTILRLEVPKFSKKARVMRSFDFSDLALPPRKQLAAVAAISGDIITIDQALSKLDSSSEITRRTFLLMCITVGIGTAIAWLRNQIATAPTLAPSPQLSPVEPPLQIAAPQPLAQPVAVSKDVPVPLEQAPKPEALAESSSRFTRLFPILQPASETTPVISTSFFPNLMLHQKPLIDVRLNNVVCEQFVRNSLRLASSNPDDRSLIDFIGDNFDDPAYGFIEGDKVQSYSPPKQLPDGTKEYTLLDEKGPTVVYWMWFTNKNYQNYYAAMGNIRIYVDGNLAIDMPAKDFFKAERIPQMQGYTWTFNQAKATGSYYPIYGSQSLKICFTEKPQWFDIRGMKLKEPLAGVQSSFTPLVSTAELKTARNLQTLRDQPENYIDTIDGVERRQGMIIRPNEKNAIELKNQFPNGTTIDSFHMIVDTKQLSKLGWINIYVDGEKTATVSISDLFHIASDSEGRPVDHKAILTGNIHHTDGTTELYFNIPFSCKKSVRFEIKNTGNDDVTIQGRFKTTDKYIPAKLCINSQEGSKVNLTGKGKLLRLDWDITTPRIYQLLDNTVSDIDEVFDQNPTTIFDGYEEKSTGYEDWTGHGFYWALWSTRSALPGGMVFTKANDQVRQTRFYRQYLSNFEGGFSQSATMRLPIPQSIKDKVKIKSTVIYYDFGILPVAEPVRETGSNNEPFYIGAHFGEMYVMNNSTGYPIGIRPNVLEDYARRFALANPQILAEKKTIPIVLNVDPVFIRAGFLSELLIKARENHLQPILIIKASINEARGTDKTSKNRGRILAEDIEEAIQTLKKIDKNYPPLRLAFTNEPNFNKDDPWGNMGWTGNGNPEGGGKAVYEASMLFSKKCPDCEIYLPALTVVGRNEAIMRAARIYAREFWEEVMKTGLPPNVKGIFANAFGYDSIQTLTDIPVTLNVWYDEAKELNIPPEKISLDFFVSEIGPGDREGQGNDFENTRSFLEELTKIISEVRAKRGSQYDYIRSHGDATIRQIIETIAKAKGMAFFTWHGGGYDMTFYPDIKFGFK